MKYTEFKAGEYYTLTHKKSDVLGPITVQISHVTKDGAIYVFSYRNKTFNAISPKGMHYADLDSNNIRPATADEITFLHNGKFFNYEIF